MPGEIIGDAVDEGGRAGLAAGEGDGADRGEDLALEQAGHVDLDVVALHLEEAGTLGGFDLGQAQQRHEVTVLTRLPPANIRGMDTRIARRPTAAWPVVRSRDLHRDDWIVALREDVVTRPGHPEDEFSRISLEHPGAVVILAVDDDERVLCLRQYRHTTQREFVELPAGLRDAGGEPAVETAKRELREEAELAASHVAAAAQHLRQRRDHRRGARHLPGPWAHPRASRGDFEMHAEEAEMEVFWAPMADLLDAVLDGPGAAGAAGPGRARLRRAQADAAASTPPDSPPGDSVALL